MERPPEELGRGTLHDLAHCDTARRPKTRLPVGGMVMATSPLSESTCTETPASCVSHAPPTRGREAMVVHSERVSLLSISRSAPFAIAGTKRKTSWPNSELAVGRAATEAKRGSLPRPFRAQAI